MKRLSGQQIRQTWLNFFQERGHSILPGASLVPLNDPTLLWINSGVAALKQYFDGSKIPTNRRITNVQKCIRTNDIENVGFTSRHHTFFEMLGNFSIGDYFREQVIFWAFEILTSEKYFSLPKENLYFTYLPSDEETFKLWQKAGVSPDHLIPLEGNFWQIGEGPCGPNTEVFFDRGKRYDPEAKGIELLKKDLDNDRYLEIWGIVFSQYNAVEGVARDNYQELPSKNIDTGAGLERIASVLQETETNFETDLFYPIIEAIAKMTSHKYSDNKMAYRVIADHIRTCSFALSDGASFSNEGRGYVLRRLLRRAMRFGRKIDINEPFMYKLVENVMVIYQDFYPYIVAKKDEVQRKIHAEEKRFLKTLQSGEQLLRKFIDEGVEQIDGELAFKLYDTYGFPLELTLEIAKENGLSVDVKAFNQLLDLQRERARNARADLQSMGRQSKDLLAETSQSVFVYDQLELTTRVTALFEKGVRVDEITSNGQAIFEETVFYAESGGQVSDEGIIENQDFKALVSIMSKAPNGQHLHEIEVEYGELKVGDEVTLRVDRQRRLLTMRNHSATHLLQAALNRVLGNDLAQAGSFVGPDYLRFDFNYDGKIQDADLQEIETIVNEMIAEGKPRIVHVLPLNEAKKLGAKALFDEKYEDIVRVVEFKDLSLEFCGGTHVDNTEDIGLFIIASEHSVASGVRRIEAYTSLGAYKEVLRRQNVLRQSAQLLKVNTFNELTETLKLRLNDQTRLQMAVKTLKEKEALGLSKTLRDSFNVFNGIRLLISQISDAKREDLTRLIDNLKTRYADGVVVLLGDGETIDITVSCGPEAVKEGIFAGDLVKALSTFLGGSGGGRKDFANGAGKINKPIREIETYIKGLIANE